MGAFGGRAPCGMRQVLPAATGPACWTCAASGLSLSEGRPSCVHGLSLTGCVCSWLPRAQPPCTQGPATAGVQPVQSLSHTWGRVADQSLGWGQQNLCSKDSVSGSPYLTQESCSETSVSLAWVEAAAGPGPAGEGNPEVSPSPSLPVAAAESEQVPYWFFPRPVLLGPGVGGWDPSAQVGGAGAGKSSR